MWTRSTAVRVLTSACAAASCIGTAAAGEIGAVPVARGGFYVTVEGGYAAHDGAGVSAFGDVSSTPGSNARGTAGASSFAAPQLATSGRATAVPGSSQAAVTTSTGGAVSIDASQSSGTAPNIARAATLSEASAAAFTASTAQVSANGASARANAQGGRLLDADSGGTGGASIGYAFPGTMLGLFERGEVYWSMTGARDSAHVDGAAAAISVDGTSGFAVAAVLPARVVPFLGIGPVGVSAEQRDTLHELGIRLKSAPLAGGSVPVLLAAEGFYGRFDQETRMQAATGGLLPGLPLVLQRNADVSGNAFGLQLALETAVPVPATPLTLVGRLSAGGYVLNADGSFSDNYGLTGIEDSADELGYRLGAEGGVRLAMGASSWLSLTGSVDHWSDAPTAALPRVAGTGPASVGTDHLTVYRALARLTFALDPH